MKKQTPVLYIWSQQTFSVFAYPKQLLHYKIWSNYTPLDKKRLIITSSNTFFFTQKVEKSDSADNLFGWPDGSVFFCSFLWLLFIWTLGSWTPRIIKMFWQVLFLWHSVKTICLSKSAVWREFTKTTRIKSMIKEREREREMALVVKMAQISVSLWDVQRQCQCYVTPPRH